MFGDVAQLGEHLLCTQGVRGSNPLISRESHWMGEFEVQIGEEKKKFP